MSLVKRVLIGDYLHPAHLLNDAVHGFDPHGNGIPTAEGPGFQSDLARLQQLRHLRQRPGFRFDFVSS
jgi:hypothetical protein